MTEFEYGQDYHLLMLRMQKLCNDFEIDAGICVMDSLEHLAKTEPSMYWQIKRYRDHVFHSCRIALLGLLLLDTKRSTTTTRHRRVVEPLWKTVWEHLPETTHVHVTNSARAQVFCDCPECAGRSGQAHHKCDSFTVQKPDLKKNRDIERLVKKIWIITALKHDVGYSLTYIRDLAEKSCFMESDKSYSMGIIKDEFRHLVGEMFEVIRSHATSLESSMHDLQQKRISHGVISALHVKGLTGDEYVLDAAARAVSRHDDDNRIVDFNVEPLAWLLLLIDELQEWGRPVFSAQNRSARKEGSTSLNLIARNELGSLGYIPPRPPDYVMSFIFDYGPTQAILEYETNFSFLHFFYQKQLNLSRLRNGPGVELVFKCGNPSDSSTLLNRQLRRLDELSPELAQHFEMVKWRKQLNDLNYKSRMKIGGSAILLRPPDVRSRLETYCLAVR